MKRFLRWLFAKPAPPDLAPTVRPQPGPVADRDGRANWSAFWSEAKRLGFDAKAVHALACTKSLAHLEPDAVEDLLNVMRDRAGYVRPAGDEKCVALTASWCGTEQRNAKRPPHGSLQGSVRRGRGSAEGPPWLAQLPHVLQDMPASWFAHQGYRGPHQGHRQGGPLDTFFLGLIIGGAIAIAAITFPRNKG